MVRPDVIIYTDGSYWQNAAGFAAILMNPRRPKRTKEVMNGNFGVGDTNQTAELKAVILGLRSVKADRRSELRVKVATDSEYVTRCFHEGWLPKWRKKNWRGRNGKERPNRKLWEQLEALVAEYGEVEFEHIRGHSGHEWNERCDNLAGMAREAARTALGG